MPLCVVELLQAEQRNTSWETHILRTCVVKNSLKSNRPNNAHLTSAKILKKKYNLTCFLFALFSQAEYGKASKKLKPCCKLCKKITEKRTRNK